MRKELSIFYKNSLLIFVDSSRSDTRKLKIFHTINDVIHSDIKTVKEAIIDAYYVYETTH